MYIPRVCLVVMFAAIVTSTILRNDKNEKRKRGMDREGALAESFKIVDVDKNGFINFEELKSFKPVIEGSTNPEDVMVRLDTNCDDQIDFDEFVIEAQRERETRPQKKLFFRW